MSIEVRTNADGSVDEVVADYTSTVHLEDLGDGNYYLRLEDYGTGEQLTVNITPTRAFVYESKGVKVRCTDSASEVQK
jgi:hypothetical protein